MSCPHSSIGRPDFCSMCIGAAPRIVTAAGPDLLIDGAPAGRPVNAADESARIKYGRRGKAQSMRVTRSKRA